MELYYFSAFAKNINRIGRKGVEDDLVRDHEVGCAHASIHGRKLRHAPDMKTEGMVTSAGERVLKTVFQ